MDDLQTNGNDITAIEVTADMQPITELLIVGNDNQLIAQLIEKSKQPHILQNTPNDAATRFSDVASFEQWQSKGRQIHWLVGPNRDLAGIIWYGKKEFPYKELALADEPEDSFAIRLYDGYVGHRLARPFMTLSIVTLVNDKQSRQEAVPGIWLQTDTVNDAAIAAYTKFGYKEVFRDETRVTMVLYPIEILAIAGK